ncbi:MAG TPA: Flp pilus assembly protein CpaB [Caulobacteraceae bacterium]|nr:Flp pilus assembly protein CpaB [Caulobacteraceae bacterium]
MTPARIMIIVVALVASVGLALFVHGMFARPKATGPTVVAAAPPAPPMTRVLVAKVDLAVGDRLSPDNMTWQVWPAATMNASYITDGVVSTSAPNAAAQAVRQATRTVTDMTSGGGPKLLAMAGAIVRDPIFAGEPITSRKIVRSGDTSYMAVRLPAGMVAMSLPINVESAAGGFINPGDRVDILSTHADTSKGGGGGMVTETVLANTLVLAIDQHTDQPKAGAAIVGATVTVEVPTVNATTVARARTQGGLTLALRSYADIAGHTQGGVDDSHSVRIFRGGSAAESVSAP